jgi:hypothetical protein
LAGRRAGPLSIQPGSHLVFQGSWDGAEGIEFAAADFLNPAQATMTEIVTALNARLDQVSASVDPVDGTLVLESAMVGGEASLALDLRLSDAARALGFDTDNAAARGDWGDAVDWEVPADVLPDSGRYADLNAVVDGAGVVWLFWAQQMSFLWRIRTSRWNGITWSAAETLAEEPGGNREPWAARDGTDRIWLFWARRDGIGTPEDNWTLQTRIFDPVPATWGPEVAVTTTPAGGRAADCEPGAILDGGDFRVFFRSDRSGGPDLWSVTVNVGTGLAGVPAPVTTGAQGDHAPSPVTMGGGLWLLYRSDRGVPLSRVATRPEVPVDNRVTSPPATVVEPLGPMHSFGAADSGTIRRYAGSTTATTADAARNGRHRRWDDLLAYTSQGLRGPAWGEVLKDDDLYTRGTLGLFLSQFVPDSSLSQQRVERLRLLLRRFLPINTRAVVVLAPRVDIEFAGDALADSFSDRHPDIEYYTGLQDSAVVALPDWTLLLSATLDNLPGDDVTADPANPATLTRRTYHDPYA